MKHLIRTVRALGRDQRGAIALFLVFALMTLITASAVAFELSKYSKAKARFNNALDQAVLAAAAANSPDPLQYGKKYFNSNLVAEQADLSLDTFDLTVNGDRTSWYAKATGRMPTTFARFVGVSYLDLSHEATVGWDKNRKTEIVAMVDVSGTMCSTFERTADSGGATVIDIVPDMSCQKLTQMETALEKIVEIGVGVTPGAATYKTGIVPYSYKLKVANPASIPAFVTAGETAAGFSANYYTNIDDAEAGGPPLPAVVPLTNINSTADKEAFKAKIRALGTSDHQEVNRRFMKRSTVGATFSALMLDPEYGPAIFGGATPISFDDPKARKIVIIMTDTANLGCCFTNWPANNYRNHYTYSYTPDNDALTGSSGLCQAMKDQGIEIWSVLLDVDARDMDERGQEILDSFRECAAGPDHFFQIPRGDTNKLAEAYTIIGKSIMSLRLEK